MRRDIAARACLALREGLSRHTTGPRHACALGSDRGSNPPAPRRQSLGNLSGGGEGESLSNRSAREHSTYRPNALSEA